MEEKRLNFINWLTEPYVDLSKTKLKKFEKFCDIELLTKLFKHNLTSKVEQDIIPSIAYHIFLNKQHQTDYYKKLFNNDCLLICKKINQDVPLKKLIDEKIKNITNSFLETFNIIYEFLEKNYNNKNNIFDIKLSNGFYITKIDQSYGDKHFNGISTTFIEIDNKYKLFFKPTNSDNNHLFINIIDFINSHLVNKIYVPKFLKYGNFHFIEYIPYYKKVKHKKEIEVFYLKLGYILAISFILEINDLHYENIISSEHGPCILDYETILSRRYSNDNFTLNETLLIKNIFKYNKFNNIISAIQGGEARNKSYLDPFVIYDGSDNFMVSYKKLSNKTSHNRIYDKNNQIIKPEYYESFIKQGFSEIFEIILKNKKQLLKIIFESLIKLSPSIRFINRSTNIYSLLLRKEFQPTFILNKLFWQDSKNYLYDKLHTHFSDLSKKFIVDSEVSDLKSGNIPYFYEKTNSNKLYNSKGKYIDNFFKLTTKEYFTNKFDNLNKHTKEKILKEISDSLNSTCNFNYQNFNKDWIK